MPYVKGVDRNQTTLFPESVEDYLKSDNPVRVIDAYVGQLDMGTLKFNFATAPSVGRPPYDPRIMLKLYLYGYLNWTRSSRRLEHEAKRNVELLWLLEKQAPDFKTIADFRKDNKKAIKEIFKDFVRLCKEWNLFGKETVAVDGTKFKASNSKKNNFSKKKLQRHKKYIDEKIERYLEELDANDGLEKEDRQPSAEELKKE
jgi:transposase